MGVIEYRPPLGSLPGEWEPPAIELAPPSAALEVEHVHPYARVVHGALTASDCARLIAAMAASGRAAPVSVSGHPTGDTSLGSVRATAWAPELAAKLWAKLAAGIEAERSMDERTPTDWYALDGRLAHRRWRAVGLGPVLRFMRYEAGGRHCAHYDAGFDYPDARRSLMSLVVYLTTVEPGTGGRTRIVDDGQADLPLPARDHDDWTREVRDDEVVTAVRPVAGQVLVFDHRLCHDVERYTGAGSRVIVRGDVVYQALDEGALDEGALA